MKKALSLASLAGTLFFFRDRAREVDFLIHRGGRYILWDAKLTETPSERDAAGLLQVAESLGKDKVVSIGVICRSPTSYRLRNGVEVLPLETALTRLQKMA